MTGDADDARTTVTKISISVPGDVLETVERECRREGESRSELIQRALVSLVARVREEELVAAYLAGYVAEPESDDEIETADEAALFVLDRSEWD